MTSKRLNGAKGMLLDSDYVIALFIAAETTHVRAKQIHEASLGYPAFMLRPVLFELATVVSRKFGHGTALDILNDMRASPVTILDIADVESDVWEEFYTQRKKSTSFFDCANLVAARHYELKIASFDNFYPAALRIIP